MTWWTRLKHPRWRLPALAILLVGLVVTTGSLIFGYSGKWNLPFNLAVLVIGVLHFRQMMRDAIAAENRERSKPTDLTPRPPPE
jgi:low affinity Fe/Cu permease